MRPRVAFTPPSLSPLKPRMVTAQRERTPWRSPSRAPATPAAPAGGTTRSCSANAPARRTGRTCSLERGARRRGARALVEGIARWRGPAHRSEARAVEARAVHLTERVVAAAAHLPVGTGVAEVARAAGELRRTGGVLDGAELAPGSGRVRGDVDLATPDRAVVAQRAERGDEGRALPCPEHHNARDGFKPCRRDGPASERPVAPHPESPAVVEGRFFDLVREAQRREVWVGHRHRHVVRAVRHQGVGPPGAGVASGRAHSRRLVEAAHSHGQGPHAGRAELPEGVVAPAPDHPVGPERACVNLARCATACGRCSWRTPWRGGSPSSTPRCWISARRSPRASRSRRGG